MLKLINHQKYEHKFDAMVLVAEGVFYLHDLISEKKKPKIKYIRLDFLRID